MKTNQPTSSRESAIDNFSAPYVLEKLVTEGKLEGEDLIAIEFAFKRFMKLVLTSTKPLAMIDRRVDGYWHMFILFTPQYREYCAEVLGFFVDHQPRTAFTPVPPSAIKNFVDQYIEKYGELDEFWLHTLTPELRDAVRRGDVPADLSFQWSGWTGPKGVL